jgi:beta-lactamase superfamily II metal-dependent hydrolase
MDFQPKHTRFRAYQLVSRGSSFSYWDGTNFCLGEARFNAENQASIVHEMRTCNKQTIDTLYISSWDVDHCNPTELSFILSKLQPSTIYYPWYDPDRNTASQTESKRMIDNYKGPPPSNKFNGLGLKEGSPWAYEDVFFIQPKSETANNNSLIALFRQGNIGVLSVGDIESEAVSIQLASNAIMNAEVDVLILSHHGSCRNFNTTELIRALKPHVCLALVDRDNQYGHPDQVVCQRASENSWYCSTKDGDVIIETTNGFSTHKTFTVWNYIAGGKELKDMKSFMSKRGLRHHDEVLKSVNWH